MLDAGVADCDDGCDRRRLTTGDSELMIGPAPVAWASTASTAKLGGGPTVRDRGAGDGM